MNKTCTKCLLELDISKFSKWRSRCKKCSAEDKADYLSRNPTKTREYYIRNQNKLLEYSREYKKSDKYKLYKKNDKHKRRQLEQYSDNSVTQESLDDMLLNQNSLCNVCKCNIESRSSRHLDHIYPISRWWLHTISNLQWLCITCNLSKSNKLPLN